jgi:hypothetical protein
MAVANEYHGSQVTTVSLLNWPISSSLTTSYGILFLYPRRIQLPDGAAVKRHYLAFLATRRAAFPAATVAHPRSAEYLRAREKHILISAEAPAGAPCL